MNPEDNLVQITTHKEITRLYKTFLELIEDLKSNHEIMIQKVAEKHGEAYANDIDCFTDKYYEQIRKRVLDSGNDCSRQLESFLEYFDFIINKEKVEAAAGQRKVVKKFVSNQPVQLQ